MVLRFRRVHQNCLCKMYMYDILILSLIVLALDSVYLSLTGSAYGRVVRQIQGSNMKMNYVGAAIAYIAIIVGLYWMIISTGRSVLDAFVLGSFSYGMYEGTNYAIFKSWPLWAVFVDTLWGGILFASTTYLYRQIMA